VVTVLLIEDDKDMQALLSTFLSSYDMRVVGALDGKTALQKLDSEKIDIVVLDLMLPDTDGHELCRRIRQKCDIPIVISSAKGDLGNKILGFELGADDYLAKPYEPRELALRLNAQLRRNKKSSYIIGDLALFEDERTICLEGEKLELTKSEYELLKLLMQNPNKAFSRTELSWHLKLDDANSRTLDTHLSNLRQKLYDDPKNPRYIKSVWGIGYKFVG
jgi:two-component system, OmpR family, response regulator